MSGSVNEVIIVGNVGADPEVRNLSNGGKVVNLRVATSESWTDKNSGEKKEKTEWIRVVIFDEFKGKVAEQYVKKGSKVYIRGALQTRKWTDQGGVERYSTEVVLQKYRGDLTILSGGAREENEDSEPRERSAPKSKPAPRDDGPDDEIPF